MATSSGLSSRSREPQEGKEVVVKCKGDTSTDLGAVSATPRGVQPPGKEDKNVKEEVMSCKPSASKPPEDATPQKKKTGSAKRREKKLKNEPSSVTAETLPGGLQVVEFAEARATELQCLLKAVTGKEMGKRTFQKLPRHMRRRAMSHNIRRLPRRLREKAAKEMEADKKPCRRKRRQPRKLEGEYRSRQRDKTWLETHIWHAKRMHMVDKWSYRLAEHCNDKGVRATYRYLRHGCLVSDISYYSCIEVAGTEDNIRHHVAQFFDSRTGLTPLAKTFITGEREGESVMYHNGGYPNKPVGPVLFLWQPLNTATPEDIGCDMDIDGEKCTFESEQNVEKESAILRRLWIWVHPSIYKEALQTLQEGTLNRAEKTEMQADDQDSKSVEFFSCTSVIGDRISVTSLQDELLRFRLLGPLAHQLVMKCLHPATTLKAKMLKEENEGLRFLKSCSKWEEIAKSSTDRQWWKYDGEFGRHVELFYCYQPTLSARSSPGDFVSGTAFGVTVLDPRLFLPKKRTSLVSPLIKKQPKYPLLKASEILGDDDKLDEKELRLIEESPFAVPDPSESRLSENEEEEEEDEEEDSHQIDTKMMKKSTYSDGVSAVRTGDSANGGKYTLFESFPVEIAHSPLWNKSTRKSVSSSKIPDHVINEIRSKFFLKPSQLYLGDEASHIPVIIVERTYRRPSSLNQTSVPYVTGCDLILPSCWGMAFWISLIYNGGRACGMKELRSTSLEAFLPTFPGDFPDTHSGKIAAQEERKALEEKYCRYPPDKRPNFGKIGIQTPFHAPWAELVEVWRKRHVCSKESRREDTTDELEPVAKRVKLEERNTTIQDPQKAGSFYVLRYKQALSQLETFILSLFQTPVRNRKANFDQLLHEKGIDSLLQNNSRALVTVCLQTAVGGPISPHAVISLPTASDLQVLASSHKHPGPVEPVAPRGLTIAEGKEGSIQIGVSQLTKREIKSAKKKRKKQIKGKVKGLLADDATLVFQLNTVTTSRETVGYVGTNAGYRHTSSHYSAIGQCSVCGLVEAMRVAYLSHCSQLVVLTRGHSLQYRYANLTLINC